VGSLSAINSGRPALRAVDGGEEDVARYITLISFTEQGIKTIKDWDKRIATTRERLEKAGGRLIDIYLTLGEFDAVAITEVPNDEAALRSALEYALGGNGRSRTMRAFTSDETLRVVKQLS
jgi:uncharacterized protein with GYD domain